MATNGIRKGKDKGGDHNWAISNKKGLRFFVTPFIKIALL
jgi:hypothetical protein